MSDDVEKIVNPPIVIDLTRSLDFGGHGVLREVSAHQTPVGSWLVKVKPLIAEESFGWDYIRGKSHGRLVSSQVFERLVPVRVERPGTGKYSRRAVLYLPKNAGDIADWLVNSDFGAMVKMWRMIEQQNISIEAIRKKMNWTEQQLQDSIIAGKFNNLIIESGKQMLLNLIGESQKSSSVSKKLFGGKKEED